MGIDSGNLYASVEAGQHVAASEDGEEHFDSLLQRPGARIERIVSTGQASPPDFWYDNPHDEWVVLLRGSAGLRLRTPASELAPQAELPPGEDGEDTEVVLAPGDWIHLPAHCRHRVDWTDALETTVWLAVHFDEGAPPQKRRAGKVV
ncbi:cupin [Cupriavidus sp. AU9028]|uniref:cupin n=1 Tax=Cupriavidus sp. AU9028 TaxID=2871157 RepID=UPI001C94366B|nr:cupin [Cupriavidus sp. AU9028]MBY4897459.1 cupin [Cupriavidus sp. AU9028]